MAVPGLASGLFLLLFPNTAISLLSGFAPRFYSFWISYKDPCLLAILCGILFAVAGSMLLARSRHFKKQLDTETRQLQEIFSKHLQDPSISEEAMEALEGKLAGFLRLSKAVVTV